MKSKRGRPCKEITKAYRVNVRLTKDEYESLEYLAYSKGESLSETVKKAIVLMRAMTPNA